MSLKGNIIIGQSGGPTTVINSSLAGVIEEAKKHSEIENVYGMCFAIEGLLNEEIVDLGKLSNEEVLKLKNTPSSILGSSRYHLEEEHYMKIMEVCKKHNIRHFIMIGGNGTMGALKRVEDTCRSHGFELNCVGIPKTVDNDLFGTDHSPGFPSAAKYTAISVLQSGLLSRDMRRVDQFVIYQSVGRDTGWLTAASVLAKTSEEDAPHILILPERPVNKDKFLAKVEEAYNKFGWVSIACGEGALWEDGTLLSTSREMESFYKTEYGAMGGGSTATTLHKVISEKFKDWRGEFQITESLPMCAMDRVSKVDLEEAFELGREAARLCAADHSGVMTCIKRESSSPYKISLTTCDLEKVAKMTMRLPDDFITEDGFMVTEKYYEYMRPIVGELPDYAKLKREFIV